MESEEELFNQNLDDNSDEQSKVKLLVISSADDYVKLHLNLHQLKKIEIEELIKENHHHPYWQFSNEVIDMTKITRNLSINDIKRLTIETLNTNADASQISWDLYDAFNISQLEKEEVKYESDDDSCGLKDKRKHQKLSKNQIKYLKTIFMTTDLTIREIQSEYNVSYSVLNKIKRSSWNLLEKWDKKNITKLSCGKRETVVKLINKCIRNFKSELTAKEIANKVNDELNTSYSVNIIRSIMKNDANLSFKRVKSRPNSIDLNRINSIRNLFSINFAKIVTEKTLLINIDKLSINRNVKSVYSWGVKGLPIESQNSVFAGSVSLIMAICSNGAWISKVINETIDSENFIWFIKVMISWLQSHNYFEHSQIILLLDNCAIHKSNQVAALFQKVNFIILYIPAYSPDFAPIEMCFSLIKRKLYEEWKRENIRLTLKHNYTKIHDSLISIKAITIKKMFKHQYSTVKEYL